MAENDRPKRRRRGRTGLEALAPDIRLSASRPTRFPTSGATAASAW